MFATKIPAAEDRIMTTNSSEMQTVLERLSRLEMQNRRLKLAGLVFFLGFGAIVLMGQSSSVPKVIEAQRFVLKDPKGNVRAWLGNLGEGSELTLGNTNKQPMMTLKVSDDASDLHLLGSQKSGMNLSVDLGTPAISMAGAEGTGQAEIAVPASGPVLSVEDASGFSAIVGIPKATSLAATKTGQPPASSFMRLDKSKKLIWKAP